MQLGLQIPPLSHNGIPDLVMTSLNPNFRPRKRQRWGGGTVMATVIALTVRMNRYRSDLRGFILPDMQGNEDQMRYPKVLKPLY